ncbi:hypothetical protein ACOMHN_062683 [Nucella lapillus]
MAPPLTALKAAAQPVAKLLLTLHHRSAPCPGSDLPSVKDGRGKGFFCSSSGRENVNRSSLGVLVRKWRTRHWECLTMMTLCAVWMTTRRPGQPDKFAPLLRWPGASNTSVCAA